MKRQALAAVLTMFVTTVPSTRATAQTAATLPAGCTYQTCALRVEREFWGPRLVRGAAAEKVGGRLSGFGKGAEVLLESPSDSARVYGRSYVDNSRRAGWLGLVALAGYAVVAWRTDNFRHGGDLGTEGAIGAVGGGLALIASDVYTGRASTDLTRGVWWYNSTLPR